MNILNVGYDSTNYYLLVGQAARLLVDVGWPGTLPKLLSALKRKGVAQNEVSALLVTHYHPDHAGLAQELKDQGVQLVVLETQRAAISELRRHIKPSYPYREISLNGNVDLALAESRNYLRRMGLGGEIISTPGHSADSVTLILDEGAAFTGDLTRPELATDEARAEVEHSWAEIRARRVKTIYPGHGPVWRLE
jgi:glyoxylase-like metal-dependent hydrolase (beta-lactamase superfamily II)